MKKITAIVIALMMVMVFAATSFAEGPMGNGPMGAPQGGQIQMGGGHMGGPQGDQMQQGWQQDKGRQSPEMPHGETPQGSLEQNAQQPPEVSSNETPKSDLEQNGQQQTGDVTTPRRGEGNGQNGHMSNRGMDGHDPINAMFDAVNAIEDETVRANIEALMQAEFDAIVAERDAEDKDAAAEAVSAAREALQAALANAGIEFGPKASQVPMNGMTPPDGKKSDKMGNAPELGIGFDPINVIVEAVNALEDETVRANIEALLQAELDAMEAEREATDRENAVEAVAVAHEALQAALSEAGIEFAKPEMGRQFQGQESPQILNK